MPVTRTLLALVAALTLLSSCGSTTSTDSATTTTTTIGTEPETPTSEVVAKEQPAIWPRADVVFATPEEAARDFVTSALGVAPVLGEFEQGDAHSGEIEVFSPGEGANPRAVSRGRLLLRQLGPDNGWFIIAAVNDNASITAPASMAEVVAGPLTVAGVARVRGQRHRQRLPGRRRRGPVRPVDHAGRRRHDTRAVHGEPRPVRGFPRRGRHAARPRRCRPGDRPRRLRRHPRRDRELTRRHRQRAGGTRPSPIRARSAEGQVPPPLDAVAMAAVEQQEVVAERIFEQ